MKNQKMEDTGKDIEVMTSVALSDPSETGSTKEEVEVENTGKGGNILVTIREKCWKIIRVMEDQWGKYVGGGNLERTRAYHVWPGKNVLLYIYLGHYNLNAFIID